jgi:hypothetical protein
MQRSAPDISSAKPDITIVARNFRETRCNRGCGSYPTFAALEICFRGALIEPAVHHVMRNGQFPLSNAKTPTGSTPAMRPSLNRD